MTLLATDTPRISQLIKFEDLPQLGFHRDRVVLNDTVAIGGSYAAGQLPVGTVMGKVTATGKWKVCKQAAADGSQNAAGIYVSDLLGDSKQLTISNGVDTGIVVLARGEAVLAAQALVWDATFTTQAQKDAAFAPLAALLVTLSPQI